MGSNKYPMKRERSSGGDFSDLGSPPSTFPEEKVKASMNFGEQDSYIDDNRINFALGPEDKLKECPYQKSHLILENRWFNHLCKCRRNYLKECGAKKVPISIGICKWHHSHHVHVRDLGRHELICPYRIVMIVDDNSGDVTPCFAHDPKAKAEERVSETEEGQVDSDTTDIDEENDDEGHEPRKPRKRPRLKQNLDTEPETLPLEDWADGSTEVPSGQPAHNPTKTILKENIPFIKIPSGLTKRERGTFRVLQIARSKTRRDSDASVGTKFPD